VEHRPTGPPLAKERYTGFVGSLTAKKTQFSVLRGKIAGSCLEKRRDQLSAGKAYSLKKKNSSKISFTGGDNTTDRDNKQRSRLFGRLRNLQDRVVRSATIPSGRGKLNTKNARRKGQAHSSRVIKLRSKLVSSKQQELLKGDII